jgi:hypothetical protein
LFRLDGDVVGLYDDVLRASADFRDLGLVIRAGYDPDQLRSCVLEDDEDEDDESDDGDSSWTISWGDEPRQLRISVTGDD